MYIIDGNRDVELEILAEIFGGQMRTDNT